MALRRPFLSGWAKLQRALRNFRSSRRFAKRNQRPFADVSPVGVSQSQPAVAETVAWLKEECGLDDPGAEQAIEYILQGRAVLGDVPTQDTIIAERFFDEGGGMQLVIHAPYRWTRSTKPGDWRCASVSAAASILSCRPQPPTTA